MSYCVRFRQYLKCSDGCYTLAGVYLSRFLRTRLDISVTSYNAHRLALVSLVVAAKFNDDVYHTNSYYAHVGGVSLKSFNDMEKEFLLSLEFDLFASPEQFAKQRALQLQILSGMDVRSLAYTLHQRSTGLFNSFDDDEGFADQTCDVQSVDSPRDRYIYQQVMGGMAILATSMTPMQRSWSRNSLAAAPRTTSSVSSTKLQSLRLKQGTSSRPCKANISAMIGKPPPRILSRQSFACQ